MSKARFYETVTACDECDHLHVIPPLKSGERFKCGRCQHVILSVHKHVEGRILGTVFSALLMLSLALAFPFLGFSSRGVERSSTLWGSVDVLINQDYLILGSIVCLALFIFPAIYLFSLLVLFWSFKHPDISLNVRRHLTRWIVAIQPWLMVDVFLVGALVALVKMRSLADIELGLSFWAFCGYVVLLIRTVTLVDRRWLWSKMSGVAPKHGLEGKLLSDEGKTAKLHSLIGCHFCGAVLPNSHSHCSRCGHSIHSRRPHSLAASVAFLIAAVIMFVPANVFPIMQTTFLGSSEPSTIMGGVFLLWSLGSYPVALVIFLASVVIPLTKILSLSWLCWQCYYPTEHDILKKVWLYRVTEVIGRWSMIDVFVVALLAGVVQMGNLISILPGQAVLSFAAVVILTMLSAIMFDPRLLWDKEDDIMQASKGGDK